MAPVAPVGAAPRAGLPPAVPPPTPAAAPEIIFGLALLQPTRLQTILQTPPPAEPAPDG